MQAFDELQSPRWVQRLARRHGLRHVASDALHIRRIKQGKGFAYLRPDGSTIRDRVVLKRFASLAVPPAYRDVRLAEDETAHLQAVGVDDRGRLQYRYHPDWQKIRELRKARRLARLIEVLPRIRKTVTETVVAGELTKDFALAGIILLIDESNIRAGGEAYFRENGTRGAATLLKSDVVLRKDKIVLKFRAKRGQTVMKTVSSEQLTATIKRLRALPGRRLFQYREDGAIRHVTSADVNAYLRRLAGRPISAKDFRTLCGCTTVLESLGSGPPDEPARARKHRLVEAVREAAVALANTPAVCRKSYVHGVVIEALETGQLNGPAGPGRAVKSEKLLATLVAAKAS